MTELPLRVDFDHIYNFPSFFFYIFLKVQAFSSSVSSQNLVFKTLNKILGVRL